jgi:hypothetical protein
MAFRLGYLAKFSHISTHFFRRMKKKRKFPLFERGSNHLLRLHMEVKGEAPLMVRRIKKTKPIRPRRRKRKK